ncbi:hypothetical protein FRC02_001175 [Tulasnella sp. 418]|nr:hypothetical protein FRC02_001175 [Tulasnella sp. 418]
MSMSTSPAMQFPEELHQDVKEWEEDDVQKFLKSNQSSFKLKDEHIQKLREQDVSGETLLEITPEKLKQDCGLTLGAAERIMKIVNRLKEEKGLVQPPTEAVQRSAAEKRKRSEENPEETAKRICDELRHQWPSDSPSTLAQKSNLQGWLGSKNTVPPFLCGRPFHSEPRIPITLLHPVFAQFLDDCEQHDPTPEDNAIVDKLTVDMCNFYDYEAKRARAFRDLMLEYKIPVTPTYIEGTSYSTDGHASVGHYVYLITEAKNEMGTGGRDPYIQSGLYHAASVLNLGDQPLKLGLLPCFHIYYNGASIGFAGSILSNKFLLEPLGDILPLYGNPLFAPPLKKSAQVFGALKKAVKRLKEYYEKPDLRPNPMPDPRYPYITCYTPLSEAETNPPPITFRYNDRHPHSPLLFFCEEIESKKTLLVKFVLNYSKEAHLVCAERGCAPMLYGFEKLAGGWHVVVMEYLSPSEHKEPQSSDRIRIRGAMKEHISELHRQGYVHGDIRRSNLLIGPEDSVKLLDFDWAGLIGVAKYPRRVNPMADKLNERPRGAVDGALITVEHDLAMVELL